MKVTAIQQGFYGHLREIGEQFEIAGEADLGDWMLEGTASKAAKKASMGHLVKPTPVNSPLDPIAAKKAEIALAQPVPSAPFKPAEAVYKVKHNGGGNFIVVDADGKQVGDVYPLDAADKTKAKLGAQGEADRLNALGTMAEPKETVAEEDAEVEEEDDGLPDA